MARRSRQRRRTALSGDIADEASRAAILAAAKKLFPNAAVIDSMKVVPAPAGPWNALTMRGLEQLARLKTGTATLSKKQLTLSGVAASQNTAADIRTALARDLPQGFTARDEIEVSRTVEIIAEADRCQDLLRETAAVGTINFDRAKADLTEDSTATLMALADIANACPDFRIEIEGHTDAEGTDERNDAPLRSPREGGAVVPCAGRRACRAA